MYRLSSIILVLFGFIIQTYAQSPHGESLKIDCAGCHYSSGWLPIRKKLNFNHDATTFPLVGNHSQTDCKACHTSLVFSNAPAECVNCHTDVHSMSVGNDCARCHTPKSWIVDNIPELHEANGFPLAGSHTAPSCVDCHVSETNLRFDRIGNDCVNCHRDDYLNTKTPDHQKASYSTNCAECHDPFSSDGWNSELVNHDFFPLTLGHAIQDCKQCHVTGKYSDASPECASCHLMDYSATKEPNHTINNFPKTCTECHSIEAWTPSNFDHNKIYPLQGAHKSIANNCVECHAAGYVNTPNTCVGCHLTDYNTTVKPNHKTAQINTDCIQCHSESAWAPSNFDHNTVYPLQGAHKSIANECIQCHAAGYVNTPNTCVGCHLTDYNTTVNPNHKAAQFSNDCKQCHTESAWTPSSFDHNTVYPLLGVHKSIANNCVECHAAGYLNTPNTCVGCHLTDYNATANPNHKTAQFPTDCKQCHSESAWTPSSFDHNTIYPLLGAHKPIASNCVQCHAAGYLNTPNTCVGCHLTDYNTTANPNHKTAQFPTDCKQCHTESAWIPSNFDHNTIYPLGGAHQSISKNCVQCHAAGYVNTPNTCVGCHLTDYNATANPNHKAALFPTDCKQCHTESAWIPSNFDHNTIYPLVEAHKTIASNCVQCHAAGYVNTPNTCVGCHQTDYNTTTNPNHTAAHFPNDCKQCHTQTAWTPATFDHDGMYFPIYSGRHKDAWTSCTECHTNSSNYAVFSCIDCHQHNNKTKVDSDHQGENGYVYASNACLNCHPRGSR